MSKSMSITSCSALITSTCPYSAAWCTALRDATGYKRREHRKLGVQGTYDHPMPSPAFGLHPRATNFLTSLEAHTPSNKAP